MVIDVKFAAVNNSSHARVPTKATIGSAGYDLFPAVDAVVPANSKALVSLKLKRKFLLTILEKYIQGQVCY